MKIKPSKMEVGNITETLLLRNIRMRVVWCIILCCLRVPRTY